MPYSSDIHLTPSERDQRIVELRKRGLSYRGHRQSGRHERQQRYASLAAPASRRPRNQTPPLTTTANPSDKTAGHS
jgi:hypothetical protein